MAFLDGMQPWKPEEEDSYIIAYGSNLVEKRMLSRCPSARAVGTSVIHGYRMLFKQSLTGSYATIEQDANCSVPVVIYRVTATDEARLDRFEGYPKFYRKQPFLLPVFLKNGKRRRNRVECMAYILQEYRFLGEPSAEYFDLLLEGYDQWGFNPGLLIKGLEDSLGKECAAKWLKKHFRTEDV